QIHGAASLVCLLFIYDIYSIYCLYTVVKSPAAFLAEIFPRRAAKKKAAGKPAAERVFWTWKYKRDTAPGKAAPCSGVRYRPPRAVPAASPGAPPGWKTRSGCGCGRTAAGG